MTDEGHRQSILMRRRRLIAAALAGVGIGAFVACDNKPVEYPHPCLSVPRDPDVDAGAKVDATSSDTQIATEPEDAGQGGAAPIDPPPQPSICLSIPRLPDGSKI